MRKSKLFKQVTAAVVSMAMVLSIAPVQGSEAATKKGGKTVVKKKGARSSTKKQVKSVKIGEGSSMKLEKGSKYTLKVTVKVTGKRGKVDEGVKFSSSDDSVVSVNKNGKLTALRVGDAKIKVTSKANKKVTASIKIKVTKKTKAKSTATPAPKKTTAPAASEETSATGTENTSSDNTTGSGETGTNVSGETQTTEAQTAGTQTAEAQNTEAQTAEAQNTEAQNTEAQNTEVQNAEAQNTEAQNTDTQNTDTQTASGAQDTADTSSTASNAAQYYYYFYSNANTIKTYPSASKAGYTEKWSEEFNGTELDRDSWNVETHEAGWVNKEQQEYVDSSENISVKDGSLIIKPVKKTENGVTTYTSGRVNTKGKHDFKYGMFEAKVKVPKGQGYLPAFWLMPTDESIYGEWPKCGEIDAMEVMGQETDKCYGTIHFGDPHQEKQKTYKLSSSQKDFSEEWHVFDVEWEPGKITWYVDGIKYHETNQWFSAVKGEENKTYPAPFNQPFYVILNLAVGGSWVGNTDDTTDFENAEFAVDYVKVYQKDSYDESNVEEPAEEESDLRSPAADGNYIVNGDFSQTENFNDEQAWQFKLAQNGEGSVSVENGAAKIQTVNGGDVDYSLQMVQSGLPMKKKAKYRLSFDAKASAGRNMKVSVQGPDRGWVKYMDEETVNLGTDWQTYSYEFTVDLSSDPNARLDFNMGNAGSTADIELKNVVLEMIEEKVAEGAKTIRSDGNYVYNGEFSEGKKGLGYWEVADEAQANVSVVNENNVTRLKVTVPEGTSESNPLVVKQSALAATAAGTYKLSYKAFKENASSGEESLVVTYAGQNFTTALTSTEEVYTEKLILASDIAQDDADLALNFTAPGTYYVDAVSITEDGLLINGSFNAGVSGYDSYIGNDTFATMKREVEKNNGNNECVYTISDNGTTDWHVQLVQKGISLENGKCYRLSFEAKSDLDRTIKYVIDGDEKKNYASYIGSAPVAAELSSTYQTFTRDFKMTADSDTAARFDIAMGNITGNEAGHITTEHKIYIDNITLVEIAEDDMQYMAETASQSGSNDSGNNDSGNNGSENNGSGSQTTGQNLLKGADFEKWWEGNWNAYGVADSGSEIKLENGTATFKLGSVGDFDYSVVLEQGGLTLEKGKTYKLAFKASSTVDRTINVSMMKDNDWYGGDGKLALTNELKSYEITVSTDNIPEGEESVDGVKLKFSLGKITNWEANPVETTETPLSDIVISDISLVEVTE